jgi:hypothetical protein
MLYGYGLVVAGLLIGATVLVAIAFNRAREWWEDRRGRRP